MIFKLQLRARGLGAGIALFEKEPFAGRVRAWVELGYNVRRWSEFGEGGHFAAREHPAAVVRRQQERLRDPHLFQDIYLYLNLDLQLK